HELFGLGLGDPGNLERHRDRGEPIRLGRGPRALDRHVDAGHGHAGLLRVALDQRDAARRDAGQECLAVGEGVGLRPRRRIEDQSVASRLAARPPDSPAAGGPHRVDLHVTPLDPSSQALSAYAAIYHTLYSLVSRSAFSWKSGTSDRLRWI